MVHLCNTMDASFSELLSVGQVSRNWRRHGRLREIDEQCRRQRLGLMYNLTTSPQDGLSSI